MEPECLRAQRSRQEISLLPCRQHVRIGDCSSRNQLSQEVMAYIDVHRVRVGHRVLRELHSTLAILEHWHSRCPHSRQHKTPNLQQNEHFLHSICHCNVFCFSGGKRNALLSFRKPLHTSTPTYRPPRNRSPISLPYSRSLHPEAPASATHQSKPPWK